MPVRMTFVAALLALAAAGATATQYSPIPRAKLLVEERRFDDAVAVLQDHLADNPDDADVLRELGEVYLAAGQWDDAIDTQEKALEMRPNDVDFVLSMAAAYREKARRAGMFGAMKNAKKWKAQLERAVEIAPDNVDARGWLVAYLVNAPGIGGGDKERGLALAQGTIAIDEFEGRISVGFAHRRRKEYDASIAQYETLLSSYADSVQVYAAYGYTLLAAGRPAEGRSRFEKWVELAPDKPGGYTGVGDCYHAEDNLTEAVAAFRRALERDPFFSDARYPLAEILEAHKHYAEAWEEYRAVAQLTPEYVSAGKAKKRAYQIKKKHL